MFCAPDSLLPLPEMMHQDDISFANIRLVHRAEKHRFSRPNTPCMDQTREQQMDEPPVLSTTLFVSLWFQTQTRWLENKKHSKHPSIHPFPSHLFPPTSCETG